MAKHLAIAVLILCLTFGLIACGNQSDKPSYSVSSEVRSVDDAVSEFPEYAQEAIKGIVGDKDTTVINLKPAPPNADKLASLVSSHLGRTAVGSIKMPTLEVLLIEQASDDSFAQMVESAAKISSRKIKTAHGYHFYLEAGKTLEGSK